MNDVGRLVILFAVSVPIGVFAEDNAILVEEMMAGCSPIVPNVHDPLRLVKREMVSVRFKNITPNRSRSLEIDMNCIYFRDALHMINLQYPLACVYGSSDVARVRVGSTTSTIIVARVRTVRQNVGFAQTRSIKLIRNKSVDSETVGVRNTAAHTLTAKSPVLACSTSAATTTTWTNVILNHSNPSERILSQGHPNQSFGY